MSKRPDNLLALSNEELGAFLRKNITAFTNVSDKLGRDLCTSGAMVLVDETISMNAVKNIISITGYSIGKGDAIVEHGDWTITVQKVGVNAGGESLSYSRDWVDGRPSEPKNVVIANSVEDLDKDL